MVGNLWNYVSPLRICILYIAKWNKSSSITKRDTENKSKQAEERAKRTLYLVTITEVTDPTVPFEDNISE